jgi:hypothetical protein
VEQGQDVNTSQLPTVRAEPADPHAGSPPAPARDPAATQGGPLVLGRYRLQKTLGAGGFGTVWAARDERLERDVAVKILPRERIVGGRFEREARAAARLSHPAIVTLFEAAVDDDGAYLVSELVRGRTLRALLDTGRLSDRDILKIVISLCDALVHAHSQGVIHRDIKPSNILVPARPGSAEHPAKLTDFGVARVIGGDSLTRTGDVLGTAAYMAPEQAEGREVGAAADLYSLALVTYEALTGVNPLRTVRSATRASRLGTYLPPLRRQRRNLPRELGVGVDLALRPRPRERGSLEELRASLVASMDQASETTGIVVSGWGAGSHGDEPADGAPEPAPPSAAGMPAGGTNAPRPSVPRRALGAAAAALTATWLCVHALAVPPVAPAAIALGVAAGVLVAPRLALVLGTLTFAVAAVAQGRPGAALLVVLVVTLTVLALPRDGLSWALPCGAVILGALGLAGAWPAVTGRYPTSLWRRAALAGAGFVWLVAFTALAGTTLYAHTHPALPPAAVWTGSLQVTLRDVLTVMWRSGVLIGAAVWAVAAAILPLIVTGRSRARDLVLATVWAAVTVSAVEASSGALAGGAPGPAPRGAVIGALVAWLIAASPALLAYVRAATDAVGTEPRLP